MHCLQKNIRLIFLFATSTNGLVVNTEASCPSTMTKLRSVQKVLPRSSPHWVGDGFRVYPVFSSMAFTKEVSPFLMFDYAEPKYFPPRDGPPLGVGRHPHRGFETVTVAFEGEVEHHDSTGKSGVIGTGDVQWMTAGRGIIHQEYHSKEFTKTGGSFSMAQLWCNLPKKHKMTKPGYQSLVKEKIPVVDLPLGGDAVLGTARVIAGELSSTKGAASTFSPIQLWDVSIPKKNDEIDLPFPAEQVCMLFMRSGSLDVANDNNASEILKPQEVAILRMDGSDTIRIRALEDKTSILIMGGEPIDEPIAAQGPFVMNTQTELRQAMSDFHSGKMGQ